MPKVVREIASSVTKVDLTTGKETHSPMSWKVAPPPKDRCQVCAAKHEPAEPHNAQSMYYQITFNGNVGRMPTWADACAHLTPEARAIWEPHLRKIITWTAPPDGEQPVKHHGIE